jgi:hypothetical protein
LLGITTARTRALRGGAMLSPRVSDRDAPVPMRRTGAGPWRAALGDAARSEWSADDSLVGLDLDAPLRDQVRSLLEAHLDASEIEVHVHGNRVTLRGRVADELAGQIAEDLTWWLPHVDHCDNYLRAG